MKLRLGLGLSDSNSITSKNNEPYVVFAAGQSLQAEKFTAYPSASTAFEAEAEQYFPGTVSFHNGAVGGSALRKDTLNTNYWWDTDINSAGNKLLQFYTSIDAAYEDRTNVKAVLWSQGNGDYDSIPSAFSKTDYKDSLERLFLNMRAEIGSQLKIIISPFHRRTSGTNNEGAQAIRQAQKELIDTYSWCYLGAEFYDLDLRDATHLTEAAYNIFAEREARRLAAIEGHLSDSSTLGPDISNASLNGNILTLTLAHNAGTDFTPTTAIEGISLFEGSTEVTQTAATRLNATTLNITLSGAPNIDNTLSGYAGYGLMLGLDNTKIVKDNSANTLPLQTSIFTPSISNIIANQASITHYVDAGMSKKTFSSGNNVTSWHGIKGGDLTNLLASEPVYDDTLFGGAGGIKASANNTSLSTNINFTSSSTQTIGFVVSFPASANGATAFVMADSGDNADPDARGFINAGNFNYGKDQASGFPTLLSSAAGNSYIIIIRYNSDSSMDSFFNSTSVTTNIDPRDDFNSKQKIQLFSRSSHTEAVTDMAYGAFFHAETAFSDSVIANIVNDWATRFGITVS